MLDIVQSADQTMEDEGQNAHSLRQSKLSLKDSQRFSAEAIRAEYKKLNRYIHRFKCKMEKNGAFMRMTQVPFESKYVQVIARAKEFIHDLEEYRKRQRALGIFVEDENTDRAKKAKQSFVSAETEQALKEAKRNLAIALSKSKASDKLNQVWLRMMVDYWESKKNME